MPSSLNAILRPARIATMLSLGYLLPSLLYIFASSTLTSEVATDPKAAANIEMLKGSLFVLVSALLIGALSYWMLNLVQRRQSDSQRLREALLSAERRATTALLSASVAHDARNELAVLKSNHQVLVRNPDLSPEDLEDLYNDQVLALERLEALTDRLVMNFRSSIGNSSQQANISELIHQATTALRTHTKLRNVDLRRTLPDELSLKTFPILIHQIVINLVLNAAEAIDAADVKDGVVEVIARSEGDQVIIEVHDNGPGIPEDLRETMFDAFVSTKAEGNGLGLISVRACASSHEGDVTIGTSPLGGALVQVTLNPVGDAPFDSARFRRAILAATA
ncbi:HAMP domain-containing histidine kinase [Lujinxingia vulgaris]|uniref:histidine kinase n=1 Tax=Lujinxingia vulgaris TaxID=2600176 RepID=A0A5C6XHV3_9DELT|nr:HAMP domain-containing sensor histidine kinase [Lujinxingia vulgaris]TXD44248.1 HAMP domain-containing histidine kinase [Lujinxingia vulgaris]